MLRIPVPYQKAPGTQCSRQRLCSGQTTVKCFYSGLCAAQSLSQPCCKCVATFNTIVDAANAFFSSEGSQTKHCLARPFLLATVPLQSGMLFVFLTRAILVLMEDRQLRTL